MPVMLKGILVVVVAFVLGVALLLGAVIVQDGKEHVISEATSPDGTWSVVVVAEPRFGNLFGSSYDIDYRVLNAEGERIRGGVIGMESDLDALSRDFTVVFESNELARIGTEYELEKSRYFP